MSAPVEQIAIAQVIERDGFQDRIQICTKGTTIPIAAANTNTNTNMSDHTGTQHALRRSAGILSRAGT